MANAKIKITMLGKFEITVNGKPALPGLAQSRKAVLLTQYLLLQYGRRVGHQELIDAVWGNDNSTNPDMALRAITHRYRLMAENTPLESSICTTRGAYEWNTEINVDIDVYSMLALLEKADAATDTAKRISLYTRALDLYKGKLLPASAGETWVERRSVQLHTRYRSAMFTLLELYKETGDIEELIARCRRGLEIDAYDERLYVELILALESSGKPEEAAEIVQCATEMGCLHAANNPASLHKAYNTIRRAETAIEGDIARIAEDLSEEKSSGSAYVCDYDTFREIYRIQSRMHSRYGVAPYLVLLTITPAKGSSAEDIAKAMNLLGNIIMGTVRHSDAVVRYSPTQYIIMLFGSKDANTGIPLERIKTQFYLSPDHGEMELSYRIHMPEPSAPKMV